MANFYVAKRALMSVPIFNGNPHIPSALNAANAHRYTNTYKSNTFIVYNSVLGNLFSTEKKAPKRNSELGSQMTGVCKCNH